MWYVSTDLDIIMKVFDFQEFENKMKNLYINKEKFKISSLLVRKMPTIKANFIFEGFEFVLFGQPQPVKEQNAYLHMIIEYALMTMFPNIREEVIKLKKQGIKTESAFCKVLGIKGDPFEELLAFGRYMEII